LVLLEEGRKKVMQKEGRVGTFRRGEEKSGGEGKKRGGRKWWKKKERLEERK
jgi:hypothetical protein